MSSPSFLSLVVPLAIYAFLANGLAFTAIGVDKRRTNAGEDRIPGGTLLLLSTVGGCLGALIGKFMFRPERRARGFGFLFLLSMLALPVFFLALTRPVTDYAATLKTQLDTLVPLTQPAEPGAEKVMPSKLDTTAPLAKKVGTTATIDDKGLPHRFGPGSDTAMGSSFKKPATP